MFGFPVGSSPLEVSAKITQSFFGQVVDVTEERRIGQVYADINSYFDDKFHKIDEHFTKIDERFAKIDERFEKIDERFSKIDERFAKIDKTLRWFKPDLAIAGITVGILVNKFIHFICKIKN